jgi:uncharacterized protein with GYD domain
VELDREEKSMAKYLWKVSYNSSGMQGLLKEGGTSRRTMADKMAANMGGSVESFHFAFGETDAYVIVDIPTIQDAAAISMAVGAVGAASVETVPLLTLEDVDEAIQKVVEYRAPGA